MPTDDIECFDSTYARLASEIAREIDTQIMREIIEEMMVPSELLKAGAPCDEGWEPELIEIPSGTGARQFIAGEYRTAPKSKEEQIAEIDELQGQLDKMERDDAYERAMGIFND